MPYVSFGAVRLLEGGGGREVSPWKLLIMDDNRLYIAVGPGTFDLAFWQCL